MPTTTNRPVDPAFDRYERASVLHHALQRRRGHLGEVDASDDRTAAISQTDIALELASAELGHARQAYLDGGPTLDAPNRIVS